MKEIKNQLDVAPVLVIVGNKFDKERERAVSEREGEEYAEQTGATHMLASAKSNYNCEACFEQLANQVVRRRVSQVNTNKDKRSSIKKVILLEDEEEQKSQ